MTYLKNINNFISNINYSIDKIDLTKIENIIRLLVTLKKRGGRIFFLGVGGSAANSSHAVNDFRKICNIESYCPTDNVSELTARTNDEGWETSFVEWLKISKLKKKDCVFIFSVGGGNLNAKVSVNIIKALQYAILKKAMRISIVGRKDGYAFKNSNCSLLISVKDSNLLTPIVESFQSIVWHCIVSDPRLAENKTKW